MTISEELREKLNERGAPIVGFADISDLHESIRKGFNYAVLIGITVNTEILNGIGNGPTLEYYNEFQKENDLLDELDEYAASIIRDRGFSAFAKTDDTIEINQKTKSTELPHKTVATKAGIGWIGKCALLVTEEFGSAIRISVVLTDAVLDIGSSITKSKCGECQECKKICPASAIKGKNWSAGKDRDQFFNAFDCRDLARERCAKIGVDESLCGLCVIACPWTKRYLEKSKN